MRDGTVLGRSDYHWQHISIHPPHAGRDEMILKLRMYKK